MSLMSPQSIGRHAEQRALDYLLLQGLQWIASNYRTKCGEIDLIMRHQDVLVFIEVRVRSSLVFGGAAASVTLSKQQKIIKAAYWYTLKNPGYADYPMRFDVISLDGNPPELNWIQQAFMCG